MFLCATERVAGRAPAFLCPLGMSARAFFRLHVMRDRVVMLVDVLELLHLAEWLSGDLIELAHHILKAFI